MGMFDDVTCDMELPEFPGRLPRQFQTKDWACELRHFHISGDGRLFRIDYATDQEESWRVEEFNGILHFYTWDFEERQMWAYDAKFTDGQCVGITKVEHRS